MSLGEITRNVTVGIAHCVLGSAAAGVAVSLVLLVLVRALSG